MGNGGGGSARTRKAEGSTPKGRPQSRPAPVASVNRAHDQDGAAAVEFAVVAIPLTMLVLGIIGFGLTLWSFQGMQAAAREGARLGSLPNISTSDVVTASRDALTGVVWGAGADVSVQACPPPPRQANDTVRVTVRSRQPGFVLPFVGELAIPRAEAVFKCE